MRLLFWIPATAAILSLSRPSDSSICVWQKTNPFSTAPISSSIPEPSSTQGASDPVEDLDTPKFLSFDDWRRQNLARAGQSVDGLAKERRPARDLHNALDVLGDEGEIDIDFGGFAKPDGLTTPSVVRPPLRPDTPQETPESNRRRPKDAGRTCKERTNYASYDCAATTLKTNPECKSPSAILVENKDTYMLNICSAANKFFIVELCDNILIDTIVLANFEFFSSLLRNFRISVSDRYPVKLDEWKTLGTWEARNSRDIQAFLVENPLIWARYLRVELLTHYGNEYYCPISLLRVHGTTMMEEFTNEMKSSDIVTIVPTITASSPLAPTASSCPWTPGPSRLPSTCPKDYSVTSTFSTVIRTSETPVFSPTATTLETNTTSPSATPSTQESFFKSVHKRLQYLETNSTLSLRYIEEQSQILRDAFAKVEKRQVGKTTAFLQTLNATVLHELLEFRAQYDEIWQSTVVEMSSQRRQSQDDMLALTRRLSLLADEMVLQKRLSILQFLLIFLCLGFVVFMKQTPTSPVVSSVTYLESPPMTPAPAKSSNRYAFGNHQQSPSADSDAPSPLYAPPTPESNASSFEEAPESAELPEPEPLPRPSSAPGTRCITPEAYSSAESASRVVSLVTADPVP